MYDLWEKHIEPKIQAGMVHKSVPDKKRWNRENIHDLSVEIPRGEVPEQFQETVDNKKKSSDEDIPFNAPVKKIKNK